MRPREESVAPADASAREEQSPATSPGTHYSGNTQHVGEGAAVMGGVGRDVTYTGGSTTHHGTNQHWGGGDNVSGDKRVGGAGDPR
ncbi:hypothetical protein ACGFW5_11075 [Streptomyces sp. NPDC048416]|uniref:hypothetical protein n=1 Tax=Streptomyces sp. NPDC048416 TaxID=3365546 RepID=UPI003719AF43